jgi:hypothetical protein
MQAHLFLSTLLHIHVPAVPPSSIAPSTKEHFQNQG